MLGEVEIVLACLGGTKVTWRLTVASWGQKWNVVLAPVIRPLALLKVRMTASEASGAAAVKWLHLLSPVTGGLGRRRSWLLGLAV